MIIIIMDDNMTIMEDKMKKKLRLFLLLVAWSYFILSVFFFWNFLSSSNIQALELLSIDFYQEADLTKIEFSFDGVDAKGKKFHLTDDKQVILDLYNVTAAKKVLRSFDTSEFSGSVVMVSPYKKPDNEKDLRVTIQLRDNVRSIIEKKGNKLILSIENRFGVFSQSKLETVKKDETAVVQGVENQKLNIPKSDSISDILDNLVLAGPKKYIGKKISINVKNMSMQNIIKLISDSSGFNIIMDDEVSKLPNFSLTLTNIPWDQTLDTVMALGKLVASKTGNILTITSEAKFAEEEKIKAEAKLLAEKQEPLVTKIFPINYADIKELSELLKPYLTKDRGNISQEVRTNSIIVKDTMDVIDRIKKIIDTLDTQTPQVLIEAKIVEAQERYFAEMGLRNGLGFSYDPISKNMTEQIGDPGFKFSSAPSTQSNNNSLAAISITQFKRLGSLDFTLQMMESESKGKIISSPKIITENNRPAEISTTDSKNFPVTTNIGGSPSTSYQEMSATLSLKVTPKVTNEGSIVLEVDLSKAGFAPSLDSNLPPDKTTRAVKTNVLVDNGSTVIIGGVYHFEERETNTGIPFLKDLPLVGWLFKSLYSPDKIKNELIIFLTPRVINQAEAGLSAQDDELG